MCIILKHHVVYHSKELKSEQRSGAIMTHTVFVKIPRPLLYIQTPKTTLADHHTVVSML